MQTILRFLRDDEGATAVEYSVMLFLIIGACMAAVAVLGQISAGWYAETSDALGNSLNTKSR